MIKVAIVGANGYSGEELCAILTGVLATSSVNPGIEPLVKGLLVEQLKAIAVTLALSVVATVVIAYLVKVTIGLRPTDEVERQGLDINEHGEEGYVS